MIDLQSFLTAKAASEGQPGHFVQIFNLDTKEKLLGVTCWSGVLSTDLRICLYIATTIVESFFSSSQCSN